MCKVRMVVIVGLVIMVKGIHSERIPVSVRCEESWALVGFGEGQRQGESRERIKD